MKISVRRFEGAPEHEMTVQAWAGPDGAVDFETGVSNVVITENYLGVVFVTNDGERLAVVHRDSGFELRYYPDPTYVDPIDVDMKAGEIHHSNEVAPVAHETDLRGLS